MNIEIRTQKQLIAFVKIMDLPLSELNKVVFNCLGAIFIDEHTKEERAELLTEYFKRYTQHEKPIFIDVGDLGVLE